MTHFVERKTPSRYHRHSFKLIDVSEPDSKFCFCGKREGEKGEPGRTNKYNARRTPLARKSKSEVALCKERIQALLREIVIRRDGGCILRPAGQYLWALKCDVKIPEHCSGFTKDGRLILQADHLNSRSFNVSYGDPRLVVCVCKGHHGWKSLLPQRKQEYDRVVRQLIGLTRAKLWNQVEQDRRAHHFTLSDWQKIEAALRSEPRKAEH